MRKKNQQKQLTWGYLPANLPAQLFKTILNQSGLHDRVLLLYKVIFNSYRRRYHDIFSYQEFVPIHSHLVEKILGEKKASAALKFLTQNDLLEMKPHRHSQPDPRNNQTRSFRIPTNLLQVNIFGVGSKYYKKVAIMDKKAFNAELCYRAERHKRFIGLSNDPVLAKLIEALQDVYLVLHTKEARELVRTNKLEVEKRGYSYLKYLYHVDGRDIEWYNRDNYGRVHNAWLSLRKVCHPLVRFKGFDEYECKEVDIKNCQAFLSAILDVDVVERILPEASDLVEGIDFTSADWEEYRGICLNGTVYEVWAEQLKQYFTPSWKQALQQYEEVKNAKRKKKKKPFNFLAATDREAAKKVFFYVLFGSQSAGDAVSECFKARFSDVWHGFKTIKSRYSQYNPSIKNRGVKGSYTNLMWMMQRIESEVVINTCVAKLLQQGVTQIVPRHDSILTPEPLLGQVRYELIKAFEYWQLPVPVIK
ncbi:hypothetical protein [Pontibacter sp. BAB1700]|uniref:hypothetical protein n=1 Tax=Pontibacter sp. BAB1700 TaxID=1144253 RepID=UPI00026BE42D|nr:hypothetical protein [Pontibacter sp. BAB1700]EJF08885.1 hypothetical protein O71_18256 [Pontibacter sp. BAB1700]